MKRFLFLCSCLLFAFITSCERTLIPEPDMPIVEGTEEMELLTEMTRQYFTQELREIIEVGQKEVLERTLGSGKLSKTSSNEIEVIAQWNKAVTVTVGGVSRTEVPLSYSKRIVSLIRVARDHVEGLPDREMLPTVFDRLVVFHGENGFRQKIIRFHPDRSYLERHAFDASHNYLHKLDKDFSGYLEYLEVTGERRAIIQVKDAKPVRKFGVKGRAKVVEK